MVANTKKAHVDQGRNKKQWTLFGPMFLVAEEMPHNERRMLLLWALQGSWADDSSRETGWLIRTAGGWDPNPIHPVPSGHILPTGAQMEHGQQPAPAGGRLYIWIKKQEYSKILPNSEPPKF